MGLKLSFSGSLEAGIDEAGRGSLAGTGYGCSSYTSRQF